MAQSDDSDSEIDPVEALLTTMPVPQNYPRFTLTTADFEEAYGGKEEYDKRVDDIKMAPYISSIEEMNSWRPMFANADQITDQFLRELVVQTERLNSATFCMHLVLVGSATETNRILRNKDEEDSFLGWFGHAYQTFWTKKGAHSVKALLTIISDAYLHVRSDYLAWFQEVNEQLSRPQQAKKDSKALVTFLQNNKKGIKIYNAVMDDYLRFLSAFFPTVTNYDLNQHQDVSACSNCAVYHVTQPPTVGNGIPADRMLLMYEGEYTDDVAEVPVVKQVNVALFDCASRNVAEMLYILLFYAGGTICKTFKRFLFQCDLGGSGKTWVQSAVLKALKPKSAELPYALWTGPDKAAGQYNKDIHEHRHALYLMVEECSSDKEKAAQANGMKIKKVVQASGRWQSQYDHTNYCTPHHGSIVANANSIKIKSTDPSVKNRMAVVTSNITTKEDVYESVDQEKFILQEVDDTFDRIQNKPETKNYILNLLLRWSAVCHVKPSMLSVAQAPDSIQHYTEKAHAAALQNMNILQYLETLRQGFFHLSSGENPDPLGRVESASASRSRKPQTERKDLFVSWLRLNYPNDALDAKRLLKLKQVFDLRQNIGTHAGNAIEACKTKIMRSKPGSLVHT
eukprot:140344_1